MTAMRTVRALVKNDPTPGTSSLEGVAVPALGPRDARLELIFGGLCHTDLAMLHSQLGDAQGYHISYPVVLGHEFVARVQEVGDEVTNISPGDRVVGSGHLTCRRCRWCLAGRSMLCIERRTIGIEAPGVWAEEFILPAENLVALPDSVSDRLGALAEPFAVAAHAVDLAAPAPRDRVAVVGPGTVGQLLVAALRGLDVTVVGTPHDGAQLARCIELGAARAVSDPDDLAALADTFDVVIEAAGRGAAVSAGVSLLGPGARMVCVGVAPDTTTFDSSRLVLGERTLQGSRSYDLSTWQTIPQRLAAVPELESLVSHVVDFTELEHACELVETRQATKVLLHP
ncbi:zinc-dependent alcohol dehydrogenase [Microbacterium sp. E-13]|uniref:zinc-dependent alcohol dehydrogenase n=1 Tax=Microbacterium sp. E-13 TaxID=3404048 RepID=UPI003CF4AA5B